MVVSKKVLVVMHIVDHAGARRTLSCRSNEFGALRFSLHGSWLPSGIPMSLAYIVNDETPAPASIDDYDKVEDLVSAIGKWIARGSSHVVSVRIAKCVPA